MQKRIIFTVVTAVFLTGCASIDRPYVTFKDSPNDKTKERVYAWTPGAAAAIGIDQYGAKDPDGKPAKDGVKFCVLTAATTRTAATSANAAIEAPALKLPKAEGGFQQSLGALVLKNESAAATYLDVGLFHLCMMAANVGGLNRADIIELTKELFKSSVEVSKSSLQWAPTASSEPEPKPATKPKDAPPAADAKPEPTEKKSGG